MKSVWDSALGLGGWGLRARRFRPVGSREARWARAPAAADAVSQSLVLLGRRAQGASGGPTRRQGRRGWGCDGDGTGAHRVGRVPGGRRSRDSRTLLAGLQRRSIVASAASSVEPRPCAPEGAGRGGAGPPRAETRRVSRESSGRRSGPRAGVGHGSGGKVGPARPSRKGSGLGSRGRGPSSRASLTRARRGGSARPYRWLPRLCGPSVPLPPPRPASSQLSARNLPSQSPPFSARKVTR